MTWEERTRDTSLREAQAEAEARHAYFADVGRAAREQNRLMGRPILEQAVWERLSEAEQAEQATLALLRDPLYGLWSDYHSMLFRFHWYRKTHQNSIEEEDPTRTRSHAILDALEHNADERGISRVLIEKTRMWLTLFHLRQYKTWREPDVINLDNANEELTCTWDLGPESFLTCFINESTITSLLCFGAIAKHGVARTEAEQAACWADAGLDRAAEH